MAKILWAVTIPEHKFPGWQATRLECGTNEIVGGR
jgi:hypothetical protein